MSENGIEYELFVTRVMQAIMQAESGQQNIDVKHNVTLKGNSGIDRQFDVYWEYKQAGITHKTIIECKDYSRKISIEKIDALKGKLRDFPGITGIIATQQGYASGAEKYAKECGIHALIIRPVNREKDFVTKSGEPLVSRIEIKMIGISNPRIKELNMMLDEEYVKEHKLEHLVASRRIYDTTKIMIEDIANNQTSQLVGVLIGMTLTSDDKRPAGTYEKTHEFENAFVIYEDGTRCKLKGIHLTYESDQPRTDLITFDMADYIQAVVGYLATGEKKMVFKDGQTKTIE